MTRLCIVLALLVVSASRFAGASPELHVEGRVFKDAAGRVVVLRGVNVAGDSKVPPFRPIASPALFLPLQRWGLNAVRLLFTWEAYETSPGVYDASYLDYYTQAARGAWAAGLYVIVDFHQDGFGRTLLGGCGEGFPAWAVAPGITQATPDNGPTCVNWGSRLLSDPDMHAAFDAFYADSAGARTRYLAMVKSVATHLAEEPGVIGYDPINEPWGDEVTQVGPLEADAARAIREADADTIIFLSPNAITSAGTPSVLPRPTLTNFAFSPHYYNTFVASLHQWDGSGVSEAMTTMDAKAAEWGVPLLVGELGAAPDTSRGTEYLDALYAELDQRLASATQWVYTPNWTQAKLDGWNVENYSIVDDRGLMRANFRPRGYPTKIAGMPVSFVATDKALELTWMNDPALGQTELFVPPGLPDSAALAVDGSGLSCSFATPTHAVCTSTRTGQVTVRVHARSSESGCGLTGAEPLLLLAALALVRRRRAS
jgi:endoglycosylceramidase